ncbi:MAG: nuclear transport factor 2 family protein [Actinomycetota bacterium]|nr:nuclear transport factor 2 family protein [Actinomycetota bacterium]
MSEENVEIVRQLQPAPEVDLVELFGREADASELDAMTAAAEPAFTHDFVCIFHALSEESRPGLRGMRECWLDWLAPWESYRTEIEELIDAGDKVLVLVRDFGRLPGAEKEVNFRGGTVWTLRDSRISRAEFFVDRTGAYEAAGL